MLPHQTKESATGTMCPQWRIGLNLNLNLNVNTRELWPKRYPCFYDVFLLILINFMEDELSAEIYGIFDHFSDTY